MGHLEKSLRRAIDGRDYHQNTAVREAKLVVSFFRYRLECPDDQAGQLLVDRFAWFEPWMWTLIVRRAGNVTHLRYQWSQVPR